MTWKPIAFLPPQISNTTGTPYSGAVLKPYAAGTTTPIAFATDDTGATLAASLPLNAAGYPNYQGTVIIPYISEDYKLALYPTQAAADADSGAVWTIDNIPIADDTNSAFFQSFDGDASTVAFTLTADLGTDENTIMVFADNTGSSTKREILRPDEYTLNGNALTFVTAPASGTGNILVFAPSMLLGAAAEAAAGAATSEANAANSATASATSAASSAATLDDFGTRYLGAKITAPTLDNDGNALQIGALYWDEMVPGMFVWTGTIWTAPAAISSAFAAITLLSRVQDFRLTLTSGLPVTTADITAATTIYATPSGTGAQIALHNGAAWNVRASAEFSIALGTLTANANYDIFCYDNASVPTLELNAWSSDTARATALAFQDGVRVKSGDSTRRYMGYFRTISTTQTADSTAKRFLKNYYHKVEKQMLALESTDTWNYTLATIRQANASTANQLNFLTDLEDDSVSAQVIAAARNSTAGVVIGALIGLDSTTALAGGVIANRAQTLSSNDEVLLSASYRGNPGAGYHFLAWLEWSTATGTTTWVGDAGVPAVSQSGITGAVRC